MRARPENARQERNPERKATGYYPPPQIILDQLGVKLVDLIGGGNVTVSAKFLRILIAELLKTVEFDQDWYARTNPDVEGARLAGDIKSLHEHFLATGYFEGRLPHKLPFDPQFYRRHYRDIAETFPASDPEGMEDHFLSTGFFEGRAGTADMLAEAEYWRLLSARE